MTEPGSIRKALRLPPTGRTLDTPAVTPPGTLLQLMEFHFYMKERWVKNTMIIRSWVLGRYFLENEESEAVTLNKTTASTGCQW